MKLGDVRELSAKKENKESLRWENVLEWWEKKIYVSSFILILKRVYFCASTKNSSFYSCKLTRMSLRGKKEATKAMPSHAHRKNTSMIAFSVLDNAIQTE